MSQPKGTAKPHPDIALWGVPVSNAVEDSEKVPVYHRFRSLPLCAVDRTLRGV